MSKSLDFILPAFGLGALILGVGYAVATRDYKDDQLALLQQQAKTAAAREAAKAEEVARLEAEMARLAAETEEKARMAANSGGGGSVSEPAPTPAAPLGIGRPALPEEVAAWNLDVLPDGRGLPVGSGDVLTGEEIFSEKCAVCHGEFAEGVDNWPKLAGGFNTLTRKDPVKTVGSYWPYLTTAWDYVHRSMPFGAAQTLSPDEVYAIVAYILYSNDLVDEDFVLSNENLASIEMPNAGGFIVDDRPQTEYPLWRAEPCMENCKDKVEITMRATVLDVTPDQKGADAAAATGGDAGAGAASADLAQAAAPAAQSEAAPAATAQPETAPAETAQAAAAAAAPDPALVAQGEKVFKKCAACHAVGEGAKNKVGPELNGIVGRPVGAIEGFRYSGAFSEAAAAGQVWDEAHLAAFLADPKGVIPGTKMSFAGLRKDEEIAAVIAYLKAQGG
ncbi:c-type cytochrome [Albidovulum sp.]